MKDFKTQQSLASQECIECAREFTLQNPCCCDDGIFESLQGDCHTDGICVECHANVHINQLRFSSQRERGE